MYAPGRRMTLLQREVYKVLLDHGMDPITLQDIALAVRIRPGTILKLMDRCVEDGLVLTYRTVLVGDYARRSHRVYELTYEGARELTRRLDMPRWPDTERPPQD